MSINRDQLRKLITDVLTSADMCGKNAVELLMLTSAQESHCGEYIEQVGGPALGIFQMEPKTVLDIVNNYLKYKPRLTNIIGQYMMLHPYSDEIGGFNLRANLPYQIIMARVYYLRFSEPLPNYFDIEAMAKYWKKYWNTKLGKGTVHEAVNNYLRYAI